MASSLTSAKTNTHRRWHLQPPRLLRQSPIPLIQSPGDDIIGVLIRNDHIPPVGRKREVPGPLPTAGVPGSFPQPAALRIDGEYCYAVMSAVG